MAPRTLLAAAFVLLLAGTAPAGDPKENEAVKRAIKGGQAYLKAWYANGMPGVPAMPGAPPGVAVGPIPDITGAPRGAGGAFLAGLALIETGVPTNDKVVASIAKWCRESAVHIIGTYELSLAIMFLDRLQSPDDEPLIQFLTVRLLSGQCGDGSWSYQCDGIRLDPVKEAQLKADLIKQPKLTTPESPKAPKKGRDREDLDDKPKPKKDAPPPAPKEAEKPEKPKGLHPSVEPYDRDVRGGSRGGRNGFNQVGSGDRSNTQFATVALWCGRRHHVDVTDALAALDKHYRESAGTDGAWGYTVAGGQPTPAMTCAGLMGLAMGFAVKGLKDGEKDPKPDADAMNKDKVLQDGLKYLGDALVTAQQAVPRREFPGQVFPQELGRNLYFMWSLERVGMVYGLETIGKIPWYEWGSQVLVHTQERTGAWTCHSGHSVQQEHATAFALLFLGRANLAQDFSDRMKGKVVDPGTARMRSPARPPEQAPKGGTTRPKEEPKSGAASPSLKTDPSAGGGTVGQLADALVDATGAERTALLEKYRDAKGGDYTDALARAIPKLSGEAKTQARDALAQRCLRFTAGTLNTMMADKDSELRRAAALAAGGKGRERAAEFADILVKLIADEESVVVQAARAALKALSGEDHGPDPGANAADKAAALTAWRNWLAKMKK